ncbi:MULTISPECIES: pentapeptide repeat-containing protein [Microbacterium]
MPPAPPTYGSHCDLVGCNFVSCDLVGCNLQRWQ